MKKKVKIKKSFAIIFCALILMCTIFATTSFSFVKAKTNKKINIEKYEALSFNSRDLKDVVYLSDIPYLKADIAWKTIGLDKTYDNAALTMKIDGSSVTVKKGIWAHATSTVDYDISNYKDYDYFITYYGLNTTSKAGNGVKFYIYTSLDGKDWTLRTEENPTALTGTSNAVRVKIDIRNANYIRLYANDNGSNASDHAVWGDAKLVKEGYSDNIMKTVEDYDKIIKENYQSGAVTGDLKLVLLQRNFIKNIGQYQLRMFVESDSEKNYETLNWFINNEEALRLWTIGGRPSGSYTKALQVLSNLYHAYKDDLSNEGVTTLGTKYKDLYLRMMLSLSLSHSGTVGLWTDIRQVSNAVKRYEIYKKMHKDGLLDTAMFESYTIDEMRGVMATNIDDEEILWLHDYSKKWPSPSERFNPYKYIKYTLGYGYYKSQYYSKENYAKWDAKYNLSKYNVPYVAGKPKLWIVFEEGAVCGGLSKTAANLYGVWGYPARVVGQPGHAAYVYLYNAGGGKYAWQLSNSVSLTGWTNTTGGGYNGWGSRYTTSNNNISTGSYLLLAQEAQNEYDKYEKAELIILLQDVYKNDRKKLEQIYRDALKEEIINLDAWIGLVNLYITDSTKTEEDLIGLAEEIAAVYTYHPLPMYDLTRRIGSKITSSGYRSKLMMIQDTTLKKATKATGANTIYHKEVPVIANALLGIVDNRVATFSFDGANAGQIVLSKQFQSAQVTWKYSLDGGNTWKEVYEHSVQLTAEQLESISATDDIKIHITGLPMKAENIYTIDIQKGVFPSSSISIDDLENRINGVNSKMQWTLDSTGEWNSFANTNPIFKGDVKVYVRMLATGIYTMTDAVCYTFTMNASSPTNRYIPRANLKVISTGGVNYINGKNILDGNTNTYWNGATYSPMTGGKYKASNVVLELDKPRYISELDYIPANIIRNGKFPTGRAKQLDIYVTNDINDWGTPVASVNNLGDNLNLKKITFTQVKEGKYIKIFCPSIYESGLLNLTFSIADINLFENPSASENPTAEINYHITQKTNQDVVAELVDENRPITVTNNGGKKTYTFDKNGEFTFEFEDINGKKGTATAKVDWIDKTAPTADVKFSTTEITNENVVATITFDKDVTITSTDAQISENPVDKSKIITFIENNTFELEFEDKLGNKGKKTITVDWIDTTAPTAEVEFSTVHLTEGEVVATLKPSEEVIVTNNGGKETYTFDKNGEFTFEFKDKAGNTGVAKAKVYWISRTPKYEVKYSTKTLTNKDVLVTLEIEDGYRIFNNNANKEYTFTKNETFNFQYKDEYGNDGLIPVTVDWIDKEEPTAEFEYSTKKITNKNVTVKLKPNKEVTIDNNGGKDTYTFTKNGEFTFEFTSKAGNKGSATARVDWIDKTAPTATITYSTKEQTEGEVVATLNPSEKVKVTNNGGKLTYTFRENAEFTFAFVDEAGNIGYATAKVNWIKKNNDDNSNSNSNSNNNKPNSNKPNSNKPTSNTNNKVNSDDKTDDEKDNINNQKETYKDLTSGNITVKFPNSILTKYKNATLNSKKLELNDTYKYRYGDNSEYYEVSLISKDNKEINVSNQTLTKIVKLDTNKKFEAIYAVRTDGSVVKLDSTVENNEASFESTGLEKYIIAYESDTPNKDSNSNTNSNDVQRVDKEESKKNNNYLFYILGGVGILLVGIVICVIVNKKNK